MKVVPDWKEMNRVLRVTLVAVFITFLLGLVFLSCDEDFYLGRTKEELYKEMFEVDSLMKTIQLQIDSTSIDFKRLYINAQRINSGHD
jgi:formate-dependent nitrite reductase membrane component NrfD